MDGEEPLGFWTLLKDATHWGIKERNDTRVEISNRIDVIGSMILGIVHVRVILKTAQKSPTAINTVVWCLSVHDPNRKTLYCYPVGGNASTSADNQGFDFFRGQLEFLFYPHEPKALIYTWSNWLRRRRGLSCCRVVGWSNAASAGSTASDG